MLNLWTLRMRKKRLACNLSDRSNDGIDKLIKKLPVLKKCLLKSCLQLHSGFFKHPL